MFVGTTPKKGRVVDTGKSKSKDEIESHMKVFFSPNLSCQSKSTQRPVNKPRFDDDDGSSSGSDKEQGLTSYYAASMNLTNSPEERKKRGNRFKRFDKGHEVKAVRHKGIGARNLYSRRTTSAPDPATVRLEEVLEKVVVMVGVSMHSATSFSRNGKRRGDTSVWTDSPLDKTQKAKMNYLEAAAVEDRRRTASDADLVDEYNQSKRSKSLVQKYQEEVSNKKKKKNREPKKQEEWVDRHQWKPWDRK
ncbi:SAC3 family protein A-like [Aristolochia californica]|uniref:SAC3 family protein A-like n=1 Tax=Aristolochia californica TaxID=171875 RepID=UPI0035D97C52